VTSTPGRDAPAAAAGARAPSALRAAATALAREAGAILLEGYGRAHRPERKGRIDLVTEYDRRSEALLLDRLRERFPGDAVFAEESGVHAGTAGNVRWLVDPLDGTTNFAHNYPFFAVSIAAEVGGRLTAAAVYDPVRDEMFDAAAGRRDAQRTTDPRHRRRPSRGWAARHRFPLLDPRASRADDDAVPLVPHARAGHPA
jgi:fructose-1,6-bisphosphatase/inositol monophosphatase family enzyme